MNGLSLGPVRKGSLDCLVGSSGILFLRLHRFRSVARVLTSFDAIVNISIFCCDMSTSGITEIFLPTVEYAGLVKGRLGREVFLLRIFGGTGFIDM